jgi:hypothetical protein
MKVKITYHIMPWEIDFALISFMQLKKSKYYIDPEVNVKITAVLNMSDYLINWDNTKLPKELFKQKFKDLGALLIDYEYDPVIVEGNQIYGILDMQKASYESDVDYYINITQDMYFSETLLASMIEATKHIKNKYFIITPEIYKMWDRSWDEITNEKYLNIPYEDWNKADIFDIRHELKTSGNEMSLYPTQRSKWAWWLDLYSKEFYEDFAPVQEDMKGYGAWDWYTLMLTEYAKNKGVDFQQYLLRGQTIFEYPIGPLKARGFTGYYKDYFDIKVGTGEQRQQFEANMQSYLETGIKHLQQNGII